MDKIVSLSKRRGFVFQSSEIYGGFGSCYDYGSLGVLLKNNIKKEWFKAMIQLHSNIVGLDAAILMSPKVWEASGHLSAGFTDPLVECKKCKKRFRADKLEDVKKCPECGGTLGAERKFNLMMKTFIGPVEDTAAVAYLRAETCQGIYVNFKNVVDSMRMRVPFGIAQVGKAFRNEITPGNFTFRMREFEQMEMQYFVAPDSDAKKKIFESWKEKRMQWYIDLGMKKENLRFADHPADKLAHYAKAACDIEYKFPWGWDELEGIHDRGDWDLSNHSKHSGQDLSYTDPVSKENFMPHIIETSAGADRGTLAFLCEAYEEIKGGRTTTTESIKEAETVLNFSKALAPIKVAVFPLAKNKKELTDKAEEIFHTLQKDFMAQYDLTGSIGKRYRRQDEIGTPYCVTVDFETVEKGTVTVRDRATMAQEKVKVEELGEYLRKQF